MADVISGLPELLAKFQRLEEAVQGNTLANAAQAGGTVIVNAAKGNIKSQGLIRTRNLSRSMHQEVTEQSKDRAVVEVGTNLEYAAIHEFGGVVTAKNAKYLAIPVGTSGTSGYFSDSPKNHPRLRVHKTSNGNLVLIDPSGRVQYVLKQSVTIPAQPYLRPALDEHKNEAIDEINGAFVKLIMKAVE